MKSPIFLLTILGSIYLLNSCSSENECDNTCLVGQVQLLNCSCAVDAANIKPQPCPDQTCSSGQILVISGNSCSCQEIINDACNGVTCPDGFNCNGGHCLRDSAVITEQTVAGFINEDVTWNSNTIYTLAGKVVISDGATLFIEAGTIIKGSEGTGTLASALVVAQGGTLMALGTTVSPIVMTSVLDNIQPGQIAGSNLDQNDNGLWGGLLVLGRAPISVDGDAESAQIEGIPSDDLFGLYGGSDANDNSGVIQYVSIRHGGALIGADNEINGLTLGGVGTGTTIENIEVVGSKDDGIEWFGGTVNVTNALIWAVDDDALDIDQAYSGKIENAIIICEGNLTDHALEIDGPEGSAAGSFSMNNLTISGAGQELGNMRDGATGALSNIYFIGFTENPVDGGEGDLTFSGDNTDVAYANGSLIFTGIEITPAAGVTKHVIFPDFNAADLEGVQEVAGGSNTVGANTSIFGWTYANVSGAMGF